MSDDKNKLQENFKKLYEIVEKNILSDEDNYEFDEKLLDKVPDKVKYSQVEKFIKENNDMFPDVEITRRIFTSYIQNGILPPVMEENQPNEKMTYYTKEQILYYVMAQQLKSIVKLDNLSRLFGQLRDFDEIDNMYRIYTETIADSRKMMKSFIKDTINEFLIPTLLDDDIECDDELLEEMKVLIKFILLIYSKSIIDIYDEI